MSLIGKSDLYYTDYSWTAYRGDDPRVTGQPDSTLLNRREGYEVLYLINKFAEKHDFKQKASGVKTEKMIRNDLPSDIRAQDKIVSWLTTNWDKSN